MSFLSSFMTLSLVVISDNFMIMSLAIISITLFNDSKIVNKSTGKDILITQSPLPAIKVNEPFAYIGLLAICTHHVTGGMNKGTAM